MINIILLSYLSSGLMSYACMRSYHYALLIIKVDSGKIDVMDSLDKDMGEYKSLVYMLDR